MTLLSKKRALVTGIASRHSLAYGIAESMQKAGAEIAISYHPKHPVSRIKPLAIQLNASFMQACDATQGTDIHHLFTRLQQHWEHFDILIHAIANAPTKALRGNYLDETTLESFQIAHEVSSYSLTALAKAAKPMLRDKGALLTLTYLGSQQAIAHYNVMGLAKASLESSVRYIAQSLGALGVRANALSVGPIPSIAARRIKGFNKMLELYQTYSPLARATTLEQVGKAAVCLCSDWMDGVTGEIIHVDNGFHAVTPFQ